MGERAHTPGRERPILFSAPMVRALLDGRKTQTRRILKPQPERLPGGGWNVGWQTGGGFVYGPDATQSDLAAGMFLGLRVEDGDRLWVREAWRPNWSAEGYREDLGRIARPADFDPNRTAIEYLADDTHELNGKNRPGIHMPRWASRLTLTVTDVRVQRLQDISRDDAAAEGLIQLPSTKRWVVAKGDQYFGMAHRDPRAVYEILWEEVNGAGSWASNPWVAAYTFTVERRNIDAPATAAKTGGA